MAHLNRIHEYKRQYLNVLHISTLHNRLRTGLRMQPTPRCFVFGGKAAPGYFMAKLIIRLTNGVAEVVNDDSTLGGRLKVVTDNLRQSDPFLVLADYADYAACQERVSAAWCDQERWTCMSILNTARGGKFSFDRAIGEYNDRIWHAQPVKITPC